MLLRALLVLIFLACPSIAFSQASISAGFAVPVAPSQLQDAYNLGFGISGSFPLPIRTQMVQPRLTAGFDVLQIDSDFQKERGEVLGGEIEGGDLSIIHVGFEAQVIRPRGSIKPYVSPFLGFAMVSVEEFTVGGLAQRDGGETAATIGVAAGVALSLPFGPHVIVEGRLLHAFTEGDATTWAPFRVGLAFDLN